jgi:hypothetical protein
MPEYEFYSHSFIFAARMMKMHQFTLCHKLSSLFMLLMLAWLTVCLPYVAESDQNSRNQAQMVGEEIPDTDESNPLTNTNEEKSESGVSLLSEYLHHLFHLEHSIRSIASLYKIHSADL